MVTHEPMPMEYAFKASAKPRPKPRPSGPNSLELSDAAARRAAKAKRERAKLTAWHYLPRSQASPLDRAAADLFNAEIHAVGVVLDEFRRMWAGWYGTPLPATNAAVITLAYRHVVTWSER